VAYLSAKSALTATEFDASVAKREEERAVSLAAAGAISQRELEQARRVNGAAQAQLADARSRMALAEKQRNATRIVAPFAGIVTEKHVSGGDVVQPGNAIYTIMDPASMRLEAAVPASELSDVKAGSRVRFRVSGYGEKAFEGRVTRVNPAADPSTGQIMVMVSIPNAGQSLVSGLFAEGRITVQSRNALLAPATSINLAGPTPTALRVKGGKVERVEVQVGERDQASEMVEVISGVSAGDTLLLGNALGLVPGTPVRVGAPGDAGTTTTPQSPGGSQ
jgi:RND family efflux transporter MFP subunit